jgi:hypothetical protein
MTKPPWGRGGGSSPKISLSDSGWSENTINKYKYTIPYVIRLSRSYYKLGSHFKYKRSLKPKHASEDDSEITEAISLNIYYILFSLEENAIRQHSKPEDLVITEFWTQVTMLDKFWTDWLYMCLARFLGHKQSETC